MRLNDFIVPEVGLVSSVSARFEEDSLGGETSGTDIANKGIKPPVINVVFKIRHQDEDVLSRFTQLAMAMDDNGDRVVYEITDRTANAMNIRQVIFTGELNVREADTLEEWRVAFKLKAYQSVPEKIEQRQQVETTSAQATEGQQVTAPPADDSAEEYTGFKRVVKAVDDMLA